MKKSNQKDGGSDMGRRGSHVFLKRKTRTWADMMEVRDESRRTGLQAIEFNQMRPQIIPESGGISGGFIAEVLVAAAYRPSAPGRRHYDGIKKLINGRFLPATTGAAARSRQFFDFGGFALTQAIAGLNKGRRDQEKNQKSRPASRRDYIF